MNRKILAMGAIAALAFPFATVVGPAPAAAQGIDIEAVFNCSEDGPLGDQTPEQCLEARNILLNNCTSCHTFVPVVKAQKSEDAWNALIDIHRERVSLSEAEWQTLGDFLKSHYNETEPVPELPPELENLGSNQAA